MVVYLFEKFLSSEDYNFLYFELYIDELSLKILKIMFLYYLFGFLFYYYKMKI